MKDRKKGREGGREGGRGRRPKLCFNGCGRERGGDHRKIHM
jgi:hypothetical protein